MLSLRLNVIFLFLVIATFGKCAEYVPIVIWHGLGDSAYGRQGRIVQVLNERLPGVYIKALAFGENESQDRFSSFFGNANSQVEEACSVLSSDPKLRRGFNALGVSQGGQFLRAIAQRCPQAPIKNLITFGAQHQGVYGFPRCLGEENFVCDQLRIALTQLLYTSSIQAISIPAQYWRDPRRLDDYRNSNIFLADINNEGPNKNTSYATNLNKVKNFVMVRFNLDTIVQPRESQWFGYYKEGQANEVERFNETALYKENWLGLRELNKRGALQFLEMDADHVGLTEQWFVPNIINKYLK